MDDFTVSKDKGQSYRTLLTEVLLTRVRKVAVRDPILTLIFMVINLYRIDYFAIVKVLAEIVAVMTETFSGVLADQITTDPPFNLKNFAVSTPLIARFGTIWVGASICLLD